MWAVEAPRSFSWPQNGAPGLFLDVYDWDWLLLGPNTDNVLLEKILLCTVLYPCTLSVYGAGMGVLRRQGNGSIVCQSSDGCNFVGLASLSLTCDRSVASGPVIDVHSAALVLLEASVANCSSTSDGAVARCFGGRGTVEVLASFFSGAQSGGVGGAIAAIGCSVIVTSSSFRSCTSTGGGGAISATQFLCYGSANDVKTDLHVTASHFDGCHAVAGGGAVLISSGSTRATVSESHFVGCWSNASGGALLATDSAHLNISDTSLSSNVAGLTGGGVAVSVSATATVSRCVLSHNLALGIGGGGVQADGATLLLEDVVAVGNVAPNGGGGALYWTGNSPPIILEGGNPAVGFEGGLCAMGNMAGYGDCVASGYSWLEVVQGFTDAYAGLPLSTKVVKKDAYNQTITTDSSSDIVTYAVIDENLNADDSVTLSGGYIAAFKAGEASLSMLLKPSFAHLDAATGAAVLKTQPTVVFLGSDMQTGQRMLSIPVSIPIRSNSSVCPKGFILVLDQPSSYSTQSARPGACSICGPGTYSVDPLTGTSPAGPSCLNCPSSAKCHGGYHVDFTIGTWSVSGGMYRLVACPPGHQLDNSISGVFSHDVQACQACQTDHYILSTTLSNVTCQRCPVGAACDGNALRSLVIGAMWVADLATGVYRLVSCPPGYEMQAATLDGQQCLLCPAGFYCVGDAALRAACKDGTYAPPGANASTACSNVVYVVLVVTLPLASVAFAAEQQAAFQDAVAAAAGVAPEYVTLSVSSTIRRAAGASIQVRRFKPSATYYLSDK